MIQKVDVLRHQIDLAVVLAEDDGAEATADASDLAPAAGPDGEDNALAASPSEG